MRWPIPWRLGMPDAQRWRAVVTGLVLCCCGAWLGSQFWQDDIETLERLRDEVAALQGQLQPAATVAAAVARAVVDEVPLEPDSGQAAQLWPWLHQRLQAQGLKVVSLRPGGLEPQALLPTQLVALEVQGRWDDWLAFERQLGQHAPWWTVTQWQVAPTVEVGQVRMQWHLRWGWRPSGGAGPMDPSQAAASVLPDWPVVAQATARSGVFQEFFTAVPTSTLPKADTALAPDPRDWPVQALRLQGLWQQGAAAHAVLGSGLQQVVVASGQRVGREAYTVVRVQQDGLVLRPPNARGPDIHLGWTGGAR